MALTKDEIQQLKEVLATKEDLQGLASSKDLQSLREEIREQFSAQNEFFSNALRDAVETIRQAHPTREELEHELDEVRNRLETMETRLVKLEQQVSKVN